MTDEAPAETIAVEVHRLRRAASPNGERVVALDLAESTVLEVLRDLQTAREEIHDLNAKIEDQDAMAATVEELEGRESAVLDAVSEAIQEAHRAAHHQGHWETCPNLLCRNLEVWWAATQKDGIG